MCLPAGLAAAGSGVSAMFVVQEVWGTWVAVTPSETQAPLVAGQDGGMGMDWGGGELLSSDLLNWELAPLF